MMTVVEHKPATRRFSQGATTRLTPTQSILERVAAGDTAAVSECLDRYGDLVWSLARRYLRNATDAEDAVQDIFVEIWRKAEKYNPEVASEATYITMIARRRLIDRYRRLSRVPDTTALSDDLVSGGIEHERQVEISEEAAQARNYLVQLRPEERKVLELSINEGMSQSQVAEAMNMPLGTVKTHARRGLIRLREMLGTADGIGSKGAEA